MENDMDGWMEEEDEEEKVEVEEIWGFSAISRDLARFCNGIFGGRFWDFSWVRARVSEWVRVRGWVRVCARKMPKLPPEM